MGEAPDHDELRRRWADTYGLAERGPVRSRRRWRGFGVVAVVLVLAGGWFWLHQKDEKPAPIPVASEAIARFDPTHPYADTPAATWSDGAAGIVLPAPVAVGTWSKQQVRAAENRVKQLLIASHLDDKLLVDHDPSGVLALLAPSVRDDVRTEMARADDHDYGGAVSLLMSGYHLLPVPIKVDGTMSARLGSRGDLVVHTNYVFAFPFAPATPLAIRDSSQVVAVQHVVVDYEIVSGSRYRSADRGIWPRGIDSYDADMGCAASEQGYLAPGYVNGSTTGDDEDPNALFDPSHPLNIADTCH